MSVPDENDVDAAARPGLRTGRWRSPAGGRRRDGSAARFAMRCERGGWGRRQRTSVTS
ncbi:hypothetical protein AB0C21_05445 [Spirillospora sp. NPDC049024]